MEIKIKSKGSSSTTATWGGVSPNLDEMVIPPWLDPQNLFSENKLHHKKAMYGAWLDRIFN
jgi:hypothetical protein